MRRGNGTSEAETMLPEVRRLAWRMPGLGPALLVAMAMGAASPAVAAGLTPQPEHSLASLGIERDAEQPTGDDAATQGTVRVAGFGPPLVLLEEDGPLAAASRAGRPDTRAMSDRMLALAALLVALCLMRLSAMRVR
ncbi:MAG: hypothetical protein AAFP17_17975 [Pseudomonadota bacterium]